MTILEYRNVLIVTAVEAERQAILGGLPAARRLAVSRRLTIAVGGVGPAAAAATTARLLALAERAGHPFDAVLSAGIAGGFAGRLDLAGVAVGTSSVAADLGADSATGFRSLETLGFGPVNADADLRVLKALTAALPAAVTGVILTVSTVTGDADRAARLLTRHPAAVAEAMEGFGVATAAAGAGVPFGEIRTISNLVGQRNRAGWRIAEALAALGAAASAVLDPAGRPVPEED